MSDSENKKQDVSITVIRRLPKYYRYLAELLEKDVTRISSKELSKLVGFTASQIRQDLNNFGGFGQQGYGYNVEELYNEVGKILGLDRTYNTILIGVGNLGQAIANYRGFADSGFQLKGLFDRKDEIVGTELRGIKIKAIDEMTDFIKKENIEIAIITVPKEHAQKIADQLSGTQIKGIWNFAPTDLVVSEDIVVENVRLNESLFTLSYFLKSR